MKSVSGYQFRNINYSCYVTPVIYCVWLKLKRNESYKTNKVENYLLQGKEYFHCGSALANRILLQGKEYFHCGSALANRIQKNASLA